VNQSVEIEVLIAELRHEKHPISKLVDIYCNTTRGLGTDSSEYNEMLLDAWTQNGDSNKILLHSSLHYRLYNLNNGHDSDRIQGRPPCLLLLPSLSPTPLRGATLAFLSRSSSVLALFGPKNLSFLHPDSMDLSKPKRRITCT
jgi:hypothetical protein